MERKVLIINASPRVNGNISRLLGAAKESLEAEGFKVTEFAVSSSVYRHCTGCMTCRSKGDCILPRDDGHRFAALLRDHDLILVGTPCYWGNMPGQLKGLFDRVVYAMMDDNQSNLPRPLMKGKRAAIIVTSNTPWPWNILFHQTSGTIRALREIFRYSGIRIAATLQKGNTRSHPGITPRDTRRLTRLLRRLTRLLHRLIH